jgi:hypothetical protein
MTDIGKNVKTLYKQQLKQNKKNTTGKLYDSINYKLNITENGKSTAHILLHPKELGKMTLNIEILKDKVEGKIFVEAERARIKLYESRLLEEEGKIDEACLILQEEQVEIIGAMEPRERNEYILEQMRLVLLRNDYIRLAIIAKKINPRILFYYSTQINNKTFVTQLES